MRYVAICGLGLEDQKDQLGPVFLWVCPLPIAVCVCVCVCVSLVPS